MAKMEKAPTGGAFHAFALVAGRRGFSPMTTRSNVELTDTSQQPLAVSAVENIAPAQHRLRSPPCRRALIAKSRRQRADPSSEAGC